MSRHLVVLAVLVAVSASGCAILKAAATGGDVVGATTDSFDAKSEAIDKITIDQEKAVGQAAALSVIGGYGGLLLDEGLVTYVNEVGNLVARQGERKVRRRNGDARIKSRRVFVGILDHDSVNAFGLPGGYVLVTRGLLEKLQSESELAWVIGHEMAHADYEHGLAALKGQVGGGAFMKGNSELNLADKYVFGKVADWFADFMVQSGFDQKAEREADEWGLALSTRAGYDSMGAWRVLTLLNATEKAQGPKPKQDKSHETPAQRYDALKSTGKIGPNTGGEIGTTRYDEQCLQRLESWALNHRPSN